MNRLYLVVMAAGMGSRYGGLKQVDPLDEAGHSMVDFSIYDAAMAGFTDVVFVIRREHESLFREMFDARLVDPTLEHYPFRMMALCLCLSTTSLTLYRRRYLVLAQALWFWVELFGGIALFYRGFDIAWMRILAILGMTFCSTFLSRISKEMEFCLMVFWIAVWVFF